MKEKIKNEYAVKNGFDDWDDLLCNALPDFVRFAINEVMDIFVNLEVEKRIKERMPSEEEIDSAAYHYGQFPDLDGMMIHDGEAQVTFAEGAEWLRSRLTSSEKPNNSHNDSQKQTHQDAPQVPYKTEGGTK